MWNLLKILTTLSFMCCSLSAQAQIYKWVDENGRTHFSQQPPSEADSPQTNNIVQLRKKSSRLRTVGASKYCGELKLPSNDDPIKQLISVESQIENWTNTLVRMKKRKRDALADKLQRDLQRRRLGYSSSSSSNRWIREMTESINDYQCGLDWAKEEKKGLQKSREQLQQEYKAAVADLEQYKNRCGPKPDIQGWTTDPRAKEWARCQQSSSTREHNKKLREVKRLKRLATLLD